MSDLRRLLSYARPHLGPLGGAFGLAVVGVALELARPFPVKFVIDYALVDDAVPRWLDTVLAPLPGEVTPGSLILWSVLLATVISLAAALAGLAVARIVLRNAFDMSTRLATEVFTKLQSLSLAYHQRHGLGDLLQRASSDIFSVQTLVSGVLFPSAVALVTLAGMFAVMVQIDPVLALLALIVVPMQAIGFAVFARPMSRSTDAQWRTQGATMALIENILGAIKAVQGFGRERYFGFRARESSQRLGDAYYTSAAWGTGYEQAVTATTGLATALMLGIGALRARDGLLTVGDLVIFLSYLGALYGPIREMAQAVGLGVQVTARARRVFEVLDSRDEVPEAEVPIELWRVEGDIVFDSVTFGYEPEKDPILHDISFHVRPGEVVAIVGISGAGKTSLVSLLSRFADPWQGRILIDGLDVRSTSLLSLRKNVGLVLQEPFLLPLSIADNIAFGLEDVSRGRIEEAARAAQAHEFIDRLPEGYDTVIGERGTTLSGGERQRLAIARALLADAPILVLDEPTSALDAHTEASVLLALEAVMQDRTVFIISHRLSTIRRADTILAIDGQRIAEVGDHDTLLAAGGVYADLFRKQHLEAR